MHVLIVKHGALGDVVRTSYVLTPTREKYGDAMRISWLTAPAAAPLLRFNPNIDDIWTTFAEAKGHKFDCVYSLDDELQVISAVMKLSAAAITGAVLINELPAYTEDSRAWFDMGLLSRFGKARADELKRANQRGHAEIFAEMFRIDRVVPEFYGSPRLESWATREYGEDHCFVGVSPFAGGRWPAKELRSEELRRLVEMVVAGKSSLGAGRPVVLLGAGADRDRNLEIAADRLGEGVHVPNTDDSVLRLAAVVKQLSALVTSDSLAMHLAIAQGVPTVAFFSPTSAAEIDAFDLVEKVTSTADDYCSYRSDADNSSITASRLDVALARVTRKST